MFKHSKKSHDGASANSPTTGPATAPATMRTLTKTITVTRRGFLQSGGVAALVGLSAPAVLAAPVKDSLAKRFTVLGVGTGKTLLVMARDIYPHDRIPDQYYVEALMPYEKQAASDATLKKLLQDGARQLDAAARAKFKVPYADIKTEADRTTLLKAIDQAPFFTRLRDDMVTSLYNNKAVWPLLGYEGSSWQKGGYLHRGFNDIDWV